MQLKSTYGGGGCAGGLVSPPARLVRSVSAVAVAGGHVDVGRALRARRAAEVQRLAAPERSTCLVVRRIHDRSEVDGRRPRIVEALSGCGVEVLAAQRVRAVRVEDDLEPVPPDVRAEVAECGVQLGDRCRGTEAPVRQLVARRRCRGRSRSREPPPRASAGMRGLARRRDRSDRRRTDRRSAPARSSRSCDRSVRRTCLPHRRRRARLAGSRRRARRARIGVGQKSSAVELTGEATFCGAPKGACLFLRCATQMSRSVLVSPT